MKAYLLNLDSTVNNVVNEHNMDETHNSIHHGMLVKGNYYDLSNNMNGGLQRIAIGLNLQNLDSTVNNVTNEHNMDETHNSIHHGMLVKGNYYDLSKNMNGGLQRIAIGLIWTAKCHICIQIFYKMNILCF